ncbi:5356_t:CDS:2 [Funneliformis geosporum]|nr:5356_t:CDS:2 [Funneliformis geosporum]
MSCNTELKFVRGHSSISNKTGTSQLVRAPNACNEHQIVRANVAFENQGENGVYCPYRPSFKADNNYSSFMNKRIYSFTVNGVKYPAVSEWKDLPSCGFIH